MMVQRILIVDDDPGMRRMFERILPFAGYEVETVENGFEALGRLELHERQNQLFDLVLSDWRMPVMNGQELLAGMKGSQSEAIRRIPVIIMTGGRLEDMDSVALSAGALVVLGKPFTSGEPMISIRAVLERHKKGLFE